VTSGYVHYLIDLCTLKFNLAACYARIPSRMDVSWNPETNLEVGVMQASELYQRAAGVYEDMKIQIMALKVNPDKTQWKEFKKHCGQDL